MTEAKAPVVIGVGIPFVMLGFLVWFWAWPGVWSKLSTVVHHNGLFYFLMFGGLVYALWRRYKVPKKFVLLEVPIQVISSWTILYILTHFFFFFGSDLGDREVWNGYVVSVKYHEEMDHESCTTTCDSDNNCTTDCICMTSPPSWEIRTSNDRTIATTRTVYRRYVEHFGNEAHVGSGGDRCAGSRGYKWETTYPGEPEMLIPSSLEYVYVNYLKASDSIRRTSGGNVMGFEPLLRAYPKVYAGEFGPIYLNRVLDPADIAPAGWKLRLDETLDVAMARLGKRKQVNVLVYLVNTPDARFLHALEEYWVRGKQNDVVVIIGATEFPNVAWSKVMSWDRGELFDVALARRILDMERIEDGAQLGHAIVAQLDRPAADGGFERMKMEELSYLAADVKIAIWAQVMIALLYGLLTFLVSYGLQHNQMRER